MHIFQLRDQLIRDYGVYTKSFIQIRDEKIREHVEQSLDAGVLWPEPLIQLNPSFEPGEKRQRGYATGTPWPATYGSGQRVQRVWSLGQVCERAALPPPRTVDQLPAGEVRMLEQHGTLPFVQEIQHEKVTVRKVKNTETRSEARS